MMPFKNDRVAAAWRAVSRAGANVTPPTWIYRRRVPLSFCARYQNAAGDMQRLLCLYNGYGSLLGFDQVPAAVTAAAGEDIARRFMASVASTRDSGDAGNSKERLLLSREELNGLFRDLRSRVLKG